MNRAQLFLIILVGCTSQTDQVDAGPMAAPDAGLSRADSGPADVAPDPCPQGCDDGWICVDDQCQRPNPCAAAEDCPDGYHCGDENKPLTHCQKEELH